jgi:hypothetical protein
LFKAELFKFGVSGQLLPQIGLGGTVIALPHCRRPSPA